jgi:tetratricopeptide (TPR) repeat protein
MATETNELAELRRAVLNDPRNADLRYLLGAEMAQQRDYEGAVLELSAAVALNPQLHAARFQLGLLHLTMAQPHHTVAVLAPLEDLDDTAALKFFKRGLEALIRDDFAPCIDNLQRGIELNTQIPPLNRDMQLIIDKVLALQQQQKAAASAERESAKTEENVVRTDFSAYGHTRH